MNLRDLLESGANVSVDSDARRFESDFQRSGKRRKACCTRTDDRRVPLAQGGIGTSKDRLFDTLVLGEDRVCQILSVRRTEALQTRGCRGNTHWKERRPR